MKSWGEYMCILFIVACLAYTAGFLTASVMVVGREADRVATGDE
jgi:hypothetical protein